MDETGAREALEKAGYQVHELRTQQADIGHQKFFVNLSGEGLAAPTPYVVSWESDLERRWAQPSINSLFWDYLSPKREAALYSLARKQGLPFPDTQLMTPTEGEPFLLEEVLSGTPLQEYIARMPDDDLRKEAYLDAVRKVGELFAQAHQARLPSYGAVVGENDIADSVGQYSERLRFFVTNTLARLPHQKAFSPQEMDVVQEYAEAKLAELDAMKITAPPTLVLANTHRGNIRFDDQRNIVGIEQCNFMQAGIPAAEIYNAFWQFANTEFADTPDVHQALLSGYEDAGGTLDLENKATEVVLETLSFNHFLRAATVYATKLNDPMRNNWGRRFKNEILFPLMQQGNLEYDHFSEIINEKWSP